jgi:hypothetical protein
MTQRERQAEANRLMAALTTGDPTTITETGEVRQDVPVTDDRRWWDDPVFIAGILDTSLLDAINVSHIIQEDLVSDEPGWWDDPYYIAEVLDNSFEKAMNLYCGNAM